MDLAELCTRSVGEQLAAIVAGIPRPERLIDAIVFESVVRRAVFEQPPAEVQMLPIQHRISVPLGAEAPDDELSRDAVRAVAKAAVLLEADTSFFTAIVLPRVLGGRLASELALTWVAVFRGQLWALAARQQVPHAGFCTVDRDEAVSLAAQGIRQMHIAGTVLKPTAAVVVPTDCEHDHGKLKIPASRYQTLPAGVWPGLLEMMARAR